MFWDRYKSLCDNLNKTPNGVAKILGVSNATCTQWKNGAIPKGDTLIKLAEYFNCSVDYLLDRVSVFSTVPNNQKITEQSVVLLDIFNELDTVNQAKLLVYADELKEQSAKNK